MERRGRGREGRQDGGQAGWRREWGGSDTITASPHPENQTAACPPSHSVASAAWQLAGYIVTCSRTSHQLQLSIGQPLA